MDHSHASPLLSLFLAEFTFGLLYAWLIHWISVKKYLQGSTAWSVVIGDAATLLIQWLFIRDGWNPFVTFACFAFSGTPMVITYLFRHQMQVEKAKHTRRPWPTAAMRARDDVVMDLSSMIGEIEQAAKENEIDAGFLLSLSNKMHLAKKILTSV
jgi:hypothetical protein